MKAAERFEVLHRKVEALFNRVERGNLDEESITRIVANCVAACFGAEPKLETEEEKALAKQKHPKSGPAALARIERAERIRQLLFSGERCVHLAT